MGDFCQQCSIEIFGKDFKELANLMPPEKYDENHGCVTICEGCWETIVDIDGKCIYKFCPKHGEQNGQSERGSEQNSGTDISPQGKEYTTPTG